MNLDSMKTEAPTPLTKPIVHLHCLCWNEEKMLPFFFRHYDSLVHTYYIADHGSTDTSRLILDAHPRVIITEFQCSETSFVDSARIHYNECWKISRGVADWVIICNIDEHFYHPSLLAYLYGRAIKGITLIRPTGYNMISNTFPVHKLSLKSQVRFGIREPTWDKPQLFNPNCIEDINFTLGRHTAYPTGIVNEDKSGKIQLLHYKYMGNEYLFNRYTQLKSRMRTMDVVHGRGSNYFSLKDAAKAELKIKLYWHIAVPVYSPLVPFFLHDRMINTVINLARLARIKLIKFVKMVLFFKYSS
jgi:hypothetical protein